MPSNSFFKTQLPNLFARLIQLGVGFATTIVLATKLSPSDLGEYYLLSALGIIINFIPLYFLHFPIQRLLPTEASGRPSFLSTHFFTAVLLFSICLGSNILLTVLGGDGFDLLSLMTLVAAFAFSETITSQMTNITSARRAAWPYAIGVFLRSATILLTITILDTAQMSARSAIYALIAGNIATVFGASRAFLQDLTLRGLKLSWLRKSLHFTAPYSLSQIFQQALARGDRFIVAFFIGTEAAGLYALAADLCRRIIQGLCITARLSYVRDAIEAHTAQDVKRLQVTMDRMATSVAALGLSTAVVIAIFGADLLAGVAMTIDIAIVAKIFLVVPFAVTLEMFKLYVLQLPFELAMRSWLDARVTIVGAITLLISMTAFIPLFGIFGVALSIFVSQCIVALYAHWTAQKIIAARLRTMAVFITTTLTMIMCAGVHYYAGGAMHFDYMTTLLAACLLGAASLAAIYLGFSHITRVERTIAEK